MTGERLVSAQPRRRRLCRRRTEIHPTLPFVRVIAEVGFGASLRISLRLGDRQLGAESRKRSAAEEEGSGCRRVYPRPITRLEMFAILGFRDDAASYILALQLRSRSVALASFPLVSATGMLGSGFRAESLDKAISLGVRMIGCDAGSTDPGRLVKSPCPATPLE